MSDRIPIPILVVSPSNNFQKVLSNYLTEHDYPVTSVYSLDEGVEIAHSMNPQFIIFEVSPQMDWKTFRKKLRQQSQFAFVPVLYITDQELDMTEITQLRQQADDFLPKPFQLKQLLFRIDSTLSRLDGVKGRTVRVDVKMPDKYSPSMTGRLAKVGLSSLVTLISSQHKKGALELYSSERDQRAHIFFQDGRIALVRIIGQEEPKNLEAFFDLMGWDDGDFKFTPSEMEVVDELKCSTNELLFRAAKMLQDLFS